MATFNGEKYIEEQILSIANQSNVNIEIIVSDDGSTDQTIKILKYLSNTIPIMIMEYDANSGSASANFLRMIRDVDISSADYVALSDQDDIWCPSKIYDSINAMGELYSGVSSDLLAFDDLKNKAWYIRKSDRKVDYDHLFQGGSAGCTYLMRAEFIEILKKQIKHLSKSELILVSHDWFIYLIARLKGQDWLLEKNNKIFYRQHSTNVYGDAGFLKGYLKKIKLINSGWYENSLKINSKFLNKDTREANIYRIISTPSIFVRLRILPYSLKLRRKKIHSIILALYIIIFGFSL